MERLTIDIPDGLDAAQKAEMAARLARLADQMAGAAGHPAPADAGGKAGALMELYGSLRSTVPRGTPEQEQATAQAYVVANYLGLLGRDG